MWTTCTENIILLFDETWPIICNAAFSTLLRFIAGDLPYNKTGSPPTREWRKKRDAINQIWNIRGLDEARPDNWDYRPGR
jgi:hypothetical protein